MTITEKTNLSHMSDDEYINCLRSIATTTSFYLTRPIDVNVVDLTNSNVRECRCCGAMITEIKCNYCGM